MALEKSDLALGLTWALKRTSQWAAARLMTRAGFRWELRRHGDLKLGLWRKSLKSPTRGNRKVPAAPKRRLVFLPGMGDSSFSWLGIFAALGPVFRQEFDELIFMDFPGFLGFLSREKPMDSMDQLVSQVHDILDTLRPQVLIGHSLGGWLAALYAEDCGEGKRSANAVSPERIVLINPGGGLATETERAELRELSERLLDAAHTPGLEWRKRIFNKEPFWVPLFAGEIQYFISRKETRSFIQSISERHFVLERLKSIRGNVDLIWSERDGLFPVESATNWLRQLSERNGGATAQLLVMKGIGHSPHVESPMKTIAVLAECFRPARASRSLGRVTRRWWSRIHLNEIK